MSPVQANIIIAAEPSKHVNMLSEALISGGHTVSVVDDPRQIPHLLDKQSCDILIADIGTDRRVNAEALNAVRKNWPDLPVICISGSSQPEIDPVRRNILITKPYRISHIEECIKRLLNIPDVPNAISAADTILVVDDDELFRTLLVRSLRLFGYSVKHARDGEEALRIIREENVRAVIADIYMPGIDGVDLLKQVKNRWPHMPVILITGYHASDEWPKASDVSPDGFLVKPFKIEHIRDLLETVTRKKTRS